MPAWEYDLFLNEINNLVKEENERNSKDMDNKAYKDAKKMSDPKYAQRMSQSYMNSTISGSNFKMPNMSMPKL